MVVDNVPDITICSCGVVQRLWIMYQTCGVVQRLWIMPQTCYHMVMWSGTEVVDYVPDMWSGTEVVDYVPDILPDMYHVVKWSGAEVVDYVPGMLPHGDVEWYRGCGLCSRHITISTAGTSTIPNLLLHLLRSNYVIVCENKNSGPF